MLTRWETRVEKYACFAQHIHQVQSLNWKSTMRVVSTHCISQRPWASSSALRAVFHLGLWVAGWRSEEAGEAAAVRFATMDCLFHSTMEAAMGAEDV